MKGESFRVLPFFYVQDGRAENCFCISAIHEGGIPLDVQAVSFLRNVLGKSNLVRLIS
jgi:hypothetical protein